MEIETDKLAYIHRKVDEVVTNTTPPGVDKEWIEKTTPAERLYALELVRRQVYGVEKTQGPIRRVIEVAQWDRR